MSAAPALFALSRELAQHEADVSNLRVVVSSKKYADRHLSGLRVGSGRESAFKWDDLHRVPGSHGDTHAARNTDADPREIDVAVLG